MRNSPVRIGVLSLALLISAAAQTVDPRGIYVYTEHLQQDAQIVTQALGVPGVDGLTLLLGWMALEPDRGNFNWTQLDQWIATSAQTNKKIALAIRAGQDTPCWLFKTGCGAGYNKPYAGAIPLNFSVSPREGVGKCGTDWSGKCGTDGHFSLSGVTGVTPGTSQVRQGETTLKRVWIRVRLNRSRRLSVPR